jgi:hypothetical protein
VMSYARLDIASRSDMLERWHPELYFHCVGVTRNFGF